MDFVLAGDRNARILRWPATSLLLKKASCLAGDVPVAPMLHVGGLRAVALTTLLTEGKETTGVVTAVAFNGYYVQDPVGDGDDTASDGMFMFNGK
jgi:hypothetical protein